MIGTVIGHYKVLKLLGQGGMASVFLAEQLGLRRQVALKLLHPALAQDDIIVQRFLREARIAANLRHDHIVTIYDVGQAEGSHYIAMRYIEGESLSQLLHREGPLDPRRALSMLEQIAGALDFAHEHGVLHRDIKPANIMVEPGDVLTLTDFGIARAGGQSNLTSARMVIGTPQYMSPEQARGGSVDKRSDLYALGVMLHEMLSGRPPFSADTTPSLLFMHVHEPPPPLDTVRPGLPRALNGVVARAMAKDPAARYQTARALVDATRDALTGTSPAGHEAAAGAGAGETSLYEPTVATPAPPPRQTPSPNQAPAPAWGTPAAAASPVSAWPPVAGPLPQGYQQPTSYQPESCQPPGYPPSLPAYQPRAVVTATPPPVQAGPPSTAPAYTPAPAPSPLPAQAASYPGSIPTGPVMLYGADVMTPTGFPVDGRRAPLVNSWLVAFALVIVLIVVLFGGLLVLHQVGLLERMVGPGTPVAVSTVGTTMATPAPAVEEQTTPVPATPSASQTVAAPAAAPTSPPTAVPTPLPAAVPTPTSIPPGDRVVQAQQAAEGGDLTGAISRLETMLGDPEVQVDGAVMDDIHETLRKLYVAHGSRLLEAGRLDESAARFEQALRLAPNDGDALSGQQQVTLARHYARMEAAWGRDDEAAIAALEAIMQVDAGFRDTREKLYALLIAKADRLIAAGDRNGAFPVLTRAQNVIPGRPEARQRLASYTPTPAPRPTTIGRPV
ncbi:MAG: serine/threonine protein kinase [Chloroflexi bacterium]|nr:serine/threonine protein kinase [Chloroflexota bacterium]